MNRILPFAVLFFAFCFFMSCKTTTKVNKAKKRVATSTVYIKESKKEHLIKKILKKKNKTYVVTPLK